MVCYLDLDPTKPEYTPHGQISLVLVKSLNLGPSFTHPAPIPSPHGNEQNQTIRAHAIPEHVVNYMDYYQSCAEDLFQTYKTLRSRNTSLPLIINFPGFLYASNSNILLKLLARFKPHQLVHMGDIHAMDIETATKMHDLQTMTTQYRGTVYEIVAHPPGGTPLQTEVDLKNMHMQSYFHLKHYLLRESNSPVWTLEGMSMLVPWEFCYQETQERTQDFAGFAMYCEPVEPASLIHALEGAIVQIIESTSSAIPSPYTKLARTKKSKLPYFAKSRKTGIVEPLDPKVSRLICTALVRGFDVNKRIVQVLVPRTHEALLYNLVSERTVFVGGCCDTPKWAYLEAVHDDTKVQNSHVSPRISHYDSTPWVGEKACWENMGYLSTARRVRKFQT